MIDTKLYIYIYIFTVVVFWRAIFDSLDQCAQRLFSFGNNVDFWLYGELACNSKSNLYI